MEWCLPYRTGNDFFTNPAKLLRKGTMERILTPEVEKYPFLVILGGGHTFLLLPGEGGILPIVLSCLSSVCNISGHLFTFICQRGYFLLISLPAALMLSLRAHSARIFLHNFRLFAAPSL